MTPRDFKNISNRRLLDMWCNAEGKEEEEIVVEMRRRNREMRKHE